MRITKAIAIFEGQSVRGRRLMPTVDIPSFDPFIRMEHFVIGQGGFPNQPHYGFEGLFYLFSGALHHDDNLGNHEDVGAGGIELFNTGYGLLHAEMVKEKAHGIRIWFDLPAHLKFLEPSYQSCEAEEIPLDQNLGVIVRTILGERSPVQSQTDANVSDVTMRAKSVYMWDVPQGFQGFVYVVVGSIKIDGKVVRQSEAVFYEDATSLPILTHSGARIMICFARPHGESVEVPSYYVE